MQTGYQTHTCSTYRVGYDLNRAKKSRVTFSRAINRLIDFFHVFVRKLNFNAIWTFILLLNILQMLCVTRNVIFHANLCICNLKYAVRPNQQAFTNISLHIIRLLKLKKVLAVDHRSNTYKVGNLPIIN